MLELMQNKIECLQSSFKTKMKIIHCKLAIMNDMFVAVFQLALVGVESNEDRERKNGNIFQYLEL